MMAEVLSMEDFYDFDEHMHRRRGHFWRYFIVAVVFLLLGATAMYYISPLMSGDKESIISQQKAQDKSEDNEKDAVESLPQLGFRGDLFISSDNPVVDIAEKVGPAIVGITNKKVVYYRDFFFGQTYEQPQEGYGSGIIISEDGYIVTNNHVVENAQELYVILEGGKEVEARLIGKDPATDIAVVKIDEPNLTVAKLGDSDKVRQGELAVAIGNPLGHELAGTVTVGVISAVNRTLQVDGKEFKLLQTDAAISPGNSGGALVNAKGEVIGMNTMKLSSSASEGLGFAIPSNVFIPIVQQLIENGKIERPGLGVLISEVTEEMAKEYGYPKGVIIVQIAKGGAADKAGLLPNDVILAIEGKEIKSLDELKETINQYKVGDVIQLRVWRSGKEFDLPIKLQQLE